ncbi:MAG: M48 family metallopeptidase [Treponema sp.]|jgi:predicted metal-dependent hydrolase|nr:M48 family metallopeptidase [Treponema sp.]
MSLPATPRGTTPRGTPPRAAENPPSQTLSVKGIPVTITRRAVRTLRITVYPDCRVSVSAPMGAGGRDIAAFIVSKLPWVEKHLARYREQERKKPLARNRFVNGEIHYVWGVPHVLKVTERRGNPKIVTGGGTPSRVPPPSPGGAAPSPPRSSRPAAVPPENAGPPVMEMYLRPGSSAAQKQALLDKWRKSLVARAAPLLAAKWKQPLEAAGGGRDFEVKKIYLQKMKTHWGSCNPARRTIRLNTELAAKPPECLEYVVLHEMVHFITGYHNRVFYGYMDSLMPGWKEIRKKMNRNLMS